MFVNIVCLVFSNVLYVVLVNNNKILKVYGRIVKIY